MTAKRIHRQVKPDTKSNAFDLDDIIQRQMQRERQLIPIRVNKTTMVLTKKRKL